MAKISQPNFTCYDMYRWYTAKLLAANPTYRAKYDNITRKKGILVIYNVETYAKSFIIDYTTFRKVIEAYNLKAGDALIAGSKLKLGAGLGYLHGRRIERSFKTPHVNIIETIRLRRIDPKSPLIYYTDDDYCRIAWVKLKDVRNQSVYEFAPSEDGLKAKFSKANTDNPLLKYKYQYCPVLKKATKVATIVQLKINKQAA